MSSFDSVILVLINDGVEREHYVWQQNANGIQEFTAPIGSLESIGREVVAWFQKQVDATG